MQVQWIIDIETHISKKTKNDKLHEIGASLLNLAEFLWSGKTADENEQLLKEELKSYLIVIILYLQYSAWDCASYYRLFFHYALVQLPKIPLSSTFAIFIVICTKLLLKAFEGCPT